MNDTNDTETEERPDPVEAHRAATATNSSITNERDADDPVEQHRAAVRPFR